jgi:hypothetical protein
VYGGEKRSVDPSSSVRSDSTRDVGDDGRELLPTNSSQRRQRSAPGQTRVIFIVSLFADGIPVVRVFAVQPKNAPS